MPPHYQPLHGQGGNRSARWADNPEACGIRCVVGITLALLFLCAVFPLMMAGWTRKPARPDEKMESKSLILPMATTTTVLAVPTAGLDAGGNASTAAAQNGSAADRGAAGRNASHVAEANGTRNGSSSVPGRHTGGLAGGGPAMHGGNRSGSAGGAAERQRGNGTEARGNRTNSSPCSVTFPALAAANASNTSARTTLLTSSSTVTSMATSTTRTTTSVSNATSAANATAGNRSSSGRPTSTTATTTTASTSTATTATTTTTEDRAALLLEACKKERLETSSMRLPLDWRCDAGKSCPHGWTCRGRTKILGDNTTETKSLKVGGDDDEVSLAASPVFMLPDGSERITLTAAGGGSSAAGLSLHLATDAYRICGAKESKPALRGAASTQLSCEGLSLHGGQGVYILIEASGSETVSVGEVTLEDQQGRSTRKVLIIPNTEPQLPREAAPPPPSSNRSTLDWIEPPKGCCVVEKPVIMTYAGKDKLPYIDGAVMLGLSLQWHVPEFPRICLVIRTMAQKNKDLLVAAGWTLIDIEEWHPSHEHFAHDYWWMVYNKIDVFRVRVKKLLWMDSDMYVWDDSLREVLESDLPEDHIAMVRDCTSNNFNSGLMLFRPDLDVYKSLRAGMVSHHGWDGLDQPLVNHIYGKRIVELEPKFNAHGAAKSCSGVVAAHYTGRNKPTLAEVANLRKVSGGFKGVPYSLRCPRLYEEYFCAMKNARNYLSDQLQAALREAGNGQSCFS